MKATSTLSNFRGCHDRLVAAADSLKSPLLLVVRLYWGWQFFLAGKGKLMNLSETADFFKDLSIPMPVMSAFLAASNECFGGLFLFVGLAARLASIPLIITMIIAYLSAESDTVKGIFRDSSTFLAASPFLFLMASLLVFIFGPGAFSMDGWIARKLRVTSLAIKAAKA